MRERDLTMIPTEQLPPGLEHVQFPATSGHLAAFRAMERAGQVEVYGSVVRTGGTVYTTIRRNGPQPLHRAPARRWVPWVAGGAVALGALAGITALVSYLVRTMTSAVSQSGPAVGFVLALALVLFGAVAYDRRKARTVQVTTVTRVRVR